MLDWGRIEIVVSYIGFDAWSVADGPGSFAPRVRARGHRLAMSKFFYCVSLDGSCSAPRQHGIREVGRPGEVPAWLRLT